MRDGTVQEIGGRKVLRFERSLPHPVERVWAALTEPEELVGWLAEAKLDLRKDGDVELRWLNTDEEGNTAVARGTVTELEPRRLLELDTDVHGVLRWELRGDENGCVLRFDVTLPPVEEADVSRALAGWHIHLEHLADALNGQPVDWPRWSTEHFPRWSEHHDRYAARIA